MHRHYYLLKTAIIVLALVTVGLNSGAGTQQIAGEITQAHAGTVEFMQVTAAHIHSGLIAGLNYLLHFCQ